MSFYFIYLFILFCFCFVVVVVVVVVSFLLQELKKLTKKQKKVSKYSVPHLILFLSFFLWFQKFGVLDVNVRPKTLILISRIDSNEM